MQRGKQRSLFAVGDEPLVKIGRLGEFPEGLVKEALEGALRKSEPTSPAFVCVAMFEATTDLGDSHAYEVLYVRNEGSGASSFPALVNDVLSGGMDRLIQAHGKRMVDENKAAAAAAGKPESEAADVLLPDVLKAAFTDHHESIKRAFPKAYEDGCFVLQVPHTVGRGSLLAVSRMGYAEFFQQISQRVRHADEATKRIDEGEQEEDDDDSDDDEDDATEEAVTPPAPAN